MLRAKKAEKVSHDLGTDPFRPCAPSPLCLISYPAAQLLGGQIRQRLLSFNFRVEVSGRQVDPGQSAGPSGTGTSTVTIVTSHGRGPGDTELS